MIAKPESPLMITCSECDRRVFCAEHGAKDIEDVKDPDDFPLFICGKCLGQYGSAFGSIVHWCSDFIGMFGGEEQKQHDGDGREVLPKSRTIVIDEKEFESALREASIRVVPGEGLSS